MLHEVLILQRELYRGIKGGALFLLLFELHKFSELFGAGEVGRRSASEIRRCVQFNRRFPRYVRGIAD